MALVDLHLHLLPAIDDGPADDDAALVHARRIAADGVVEATVTPHVGSPYFFVDHTTIAERTADLQRLLDDEGIALRLHPGGELHPEADLSDDLLATIAQGPAGRRWVLAEVPFGGIDDAFADHLDEIGRRGYTPLIGHPERAAGVLGDGGLARLRPALAAGARLQVNACSLMGRQGDEARHAGAELLRRGLVDVIASDGHGGSRGHSLAAGVDAARALGSDAAYTAELTSLRPRALLERGVARVPAAASAH